MSRHKPYSPEPRRRALTFTPDQLARQAVIGAEIQALGRERHPERFAADGTPLLGFAGSSWIERQASYLRARETR